MLKPAFILLFILLSVSGFGASPLKERPNIIFIHVDQMSQLNSISALGGKNIRTPAIDKLAENGVSFTQSFATDPVCCPSRSSWWSGMWSSEHGVVVNGSASHDDAPDWGYKTFYVGKWHVPGKSVRELFTVLHEGSWWGEITDQEVTASARSFLRNYKDSEPFFLSVGYLNPHDICITPLIDNSRIEKDKKSAQKVITKAAEIKPKNIADFKLSFSYDSREPTLLLNKRKQKGFPNWDVNMWYVHQYNYLRFVEMVDMEIDLLLKELERSAWKDNTIVIFTSDHGEGMGRHQLIGKGSLYEESVRVPLIFSTLGNSINVSKKIVNIEHLVSGIDFARTVCDYAGINSDLIPHGRSLRPIVEGESLEDWREYVYAETMVYMKMVRGHRYKYIREYIEDETVTGIPPSHTTHNVGVEQLFDLIEDPNEQCNLAYDKEYQGVLKNLRKVMNEKEDSRVPLKEIAHPRGRDYMEKIPLSLRKMQYPTSYPVK